MLLPIEYARLTFESGWERYRERENRRERRSRSYSYPDVVIHECLFNVATFLSFVYRGGLTYVELNSGSSETTRRRKRQRGEELEKLTSMRKNEIERIGKADPSILPRLATLNTNRGTWRRIPGMHRYAMREMIRQERKRKRKKKKKTGKRGSGYFSQRKQTRYVPGNFNRLHFDVSTRWTFPIRPDGDSWRQKSATTCLEVMSGRVKLYQQESNSTTMRVSDGSRET